MTWFDRQGQYIDSMFEFAPSVGWLGLMVLPLVFQYPELHPTGRLLQVTLVSLIGLLMLVADSLCFRTSLVRLIDGGPRVSNYWLAATGLCFLLPAAAHLYLMPHIPLLVGIVDSDATFSSLMLLRHESAKLLQVPTLVKYVFNWTLLVFAPVYIVIAVFVGHWRLGLAGLVVAAIYAVATLAKLPLVLLLTSCLFAFCVMPTRFKRGLSVSLTGFALFGLTMTGVLMASGSLTFLKGSNAELLAPVFEQMQPDDPRRALTYGDYYRLDVAEADPQRSRFGALVQYVVYRTWLTPADVSNRWYQYFVYVQKEPLGLQSLIVAPRGAGAEAPSRTVGIWAYRTRFPHKYLDTISAYASFDADAFARGGILGVVIAAVLLLAARISAAMLVTAHPVGLASYGVLLCVLAILPSSASLQAIVGANGLFIVLIVLLGIRLLERPGKGKAAVAGGSL